MIELVFVEGGKESWIAKWETSLELFENADPMNDLQDRQ